MTRILLLLSFVWCTATVLPAQTLATEAPADTSYWKSGGGVGLDFAQMALFQPRVGAGANRIGFGGLATVFANYEKDKLAWSNTGSLQLGAQRIGGKNADFEKNIDIFRLNSRAGYKIIGDKIFAAVEANATTLLLTTYQGNLLNPKTDDENAIAQFLSPLILQVSPGIDYRPNQNLSIFFSPASFKLIYVGNDSIAALNVHGNKPGENSFSLFGANLKVGYNKNFLNDRITWQSALDLYSNFLESPQNVDLLWTNNLGIVINKNLSLQLVTEMFYDDDVNVQIDRDDDGIVGEAAADVNLPPAEQRDELAPALSFVQGLFLKYNIVF